MIQVEAFRELNLVRVPPVPFAGLVTADQHDSVPVGVEREQDSGATVNPRFLQLVQARPVNDVDVWPAERGAEAGDAGNRARDFRPQLAIESRHPALELTRRHHGAGRRLVGTGGCVFGHMGKSRQRAISAPRTAPVSARTTPRVKPISRRVSISGSFLVAGAGFKPAVFGPRARRPASPDPDVNALRSQR